MNTEDVQLCMSQYDDVDTGQRIPCDRELHHSGVHLGKITRGEHTDELLQWTDGAAVNDSEPVSELPVWYSVLPIGQHVKISYRDALDPLHDGELHGAVLDDHEQVSALVVNYVDGRSARPRRVLVPWHNIAALSWEVEQ